ncbi:MAG: acyl-CoA synthetase [Nitrospiraceae bacterium]|nr:acyl-CoA synthetase [Nitrospiraceae bacterium]
MKEYGLLFPRSEMATSPDEAAEMASKIGFPVALKIVSPDILHKTDIGGVQLDLGSKKAVRKAFLKIMDTVADKAPKATVVGVRVEEMCSGGVEVFVGLENNPQFGPTITFGLGGIFTEVLHDVTFRVLPITPEDAALMIKEIKGSEILEGFRGQPRVSENLLIELLLRVGKMGIDLADRLEAIDLNPILVWGDQHRVLDAKVLFTDKSHPLKSEEPNTAYLDGFFNAKSVAVVGASATPGKIGNAILDSLVNHQYKGRVYPINPQWKEIFGLSTYSSLRDVPGAVDLVVVAIPLSAVPQVIRECAEKNVHNMVIVSGGGKELGNAGKALEAEISRLAQEANLRIVGPNCIGVFNGKTRLDTFFQVYGRMTRPREGSIAVLTQSGTVGVALLEQTAGLGLSKFVSYGNRLDVDEADLIAYLGEDPATKVIACYIEGLNDGRKFLNAARKVALRKPIVVFKAGRTPAAAKASLSHTGFFGGTYGPWKGAFAQVGVISVDSMEELFATLKGLSMQPPAQGNRIAMISNGAGPMVQAMDLLDRYELQIARLADETLEGMRHEYPSYFVVQNPVDITGSGTAHDYEVGINALLADLNVDIVMPWFVFQDPALGEEIVEILNDLSEKYGKPIVCGAMGGSYTQRMSSRIEAMGLPVFHSVQEWVAAGAGLCRGARQRS